LRSRRLCRCCRTEERNEEKKPHRINCHDHCSACDLHFHGLAAFDAHRVDGECVEDPLSVMTQSETPRPKLQVLTTEGYCRLQKGAMKDGRLVNEYHPVTIYQGYVAVSQESQIAGYGQKVLW